MDLDGWRQVGVIFQALLGPDKSNTRFVAVNYRDLSLTCGSAGENVGDVCYHGPFKPPQALVRVTLPQTVTEVTGALQLGLELFILYAV